ncbi:MAG: NifU N-terminal domain-containing protein [Actinomycetota bacterium]
MISVESTPNPNAVKFVVGQPVGGPMTYMAGKPAESPMAQQLLDLPGVTSVFLTANFVTVSKTQDAEWGEIVSEAVAILEDHYG